jgi:hypothetical protein
MSADTWKFFIVMIIMIMAFASALFILALKNCNELTPEEFSLNELCTSGDNDLIALFYGSVYLSFGDFAMDYTLDDGLM